MAFDHERLDVYRLVELIAWVGDLLDGSLRDIWGTAKKHLDEARHSVANNIAEGNGKRSRADRCRFLDIARGSALESAACLDALAARKHLSAAELAHGKPMLERIVSMLWPMIEALERDPSPTTSPRTRTSTSTSTSTRVTANRAR